MDNAAVGYTVWFSVAWMVTVLLLVLLVGFLAWCALRKARPEEVSSVLAEVRAIVHALALFLPLSRLSRSNGVRVGTVIRPRLPQEPIMDEADSLTGATVLAAELPAAVERSPR
ncbi:hypothetical protein AB0O91_36810 [Kitasatospora sp. NPDC089797]|uniref:hypothetical protein n=1 Tax=Kitasatospora sp. NPDC089797 TaxID=3155298 RepID=UPI003447B933